MRFVLLAALAASIASAAAQTGWSRYRVYVDTDEQAQRLGDSSLQLFSEQVSLGYTDVIVGPGQLPELWSLGLDHKFVSALPDADAWRDVVRTQIDDYRYNYLDYANMIAQYEVWRAANPTLVTRQQIATSWGNRAVWAYRISNQKTATSQVANVVIIGGIHAREWISPSTCMYFADNLIDRIKNDPAYANLMRRVAVYIIPSLNPDGYVYTWTNDRYWRKNRRNNGNGTRGVDLNRNYATGWGGQGSSSNTSSEIYRGPSPMSEPENQGLANLVQNLPNVVGFIDYHSYSQLIMWPWGYQSALCPDDAVHRFVGGRMRSAIFNYSGMVYQDGPINTTIYPASGTTVDWFYSPIGAISMTVELRDTGQYGFLLPESQILPTQQENWQAFQSFLFDVAVRRTSGVRK
jgi:murein tripeptide amidase MpaA